MAARNPIKKPGAQSLRSLQSLSSCLDITLADLKTAIAMPSHQRYKKKQVKKINGEFRDVYDPHQLIRRIQKRINNRIFKELILWPDYIYGSVPTNKDEKKKELSGIISLVPVSTVMQKQYLK